MKLLNLERMEEEAIDTTNDDSNSFVETFCKGIDSRGILQDDFYFETDFLALKGNPDYLKLMRTLAILEAQRVKVSQSIDKLEELRHKVLKDPNLVKEEIFKRKESYLFRCNIEKVPDIDWSKYQRFNSRNPLLTRRMAKVQQFSEKTNHLEKGDNRIKVRGRVYNEEKPETFNQLWTVEEQLRLEALLVEFPPEPVENRRWKKIADALGNRTTQQVCSRVQKYFKKLHKAGLDVPATSKRYGRQKPSHVHKRHKHLLYKPTTFFPGAAMAVLGDSDGESSSSSDTADLTHWNEILLMIKSEKSSSETAPKVHHYGYKCDRCSESPIVGLRWECATCPTVSMCSDCMVALLDEPSPPKHPLTHNFKPKKVFVNRSYSSVAFSTNNYLDPNFIR
ncbi:ada2a-containing complex component 1 [Rhodnius prolixus]|uniref:ada2a-containing complex component 1 n=1 Tax=Rhodnius prolixus TaxID=13249 RepID=UPI003D188CFF